MLEDDERGQKQTAYQILVASSPEILAKDQGDLWAFDPFACSTDFVNWTKWSGPDLVHPSEPWDSKFAHKPWVVKHDGVVYHFYCAVGDQGRVIGLATSKDLKAQKK
jgi:predicted GH43/DUF377 family glycosyl hydrolase